MKPVVSDAGPLIALSRIGRLALLRGLFGKVFIPQAVLVELRLGEKRPGILLLEQALSQGKWLRPRGPQIGLPIACLDPGESQAIRLAEEMHCLLLVDERRGRIAARKRGVRVIGTGRVLIAAKRKGFIHRVDAALHELRDNGYRLSDDLCRRILILAGEARR
ncbi:MAG: DUF3368 domain-containing protein [Acidobacteriota bacterium]